MINSLIVLLTAHCIADYPLQGEFLANFKGKNLFLLFVHSFIWAGVIYFALHLLKGTTATEWKFVFLLLGHMTIDKWKCSRKDKSRALTTDLYIDQFLHLLQIVIVMLF